MRLLPSTSAFLIIAWLALSSASRAADSTASDNPRVTVQRCPDGGAPVCARVTRDGAVHLLYDLNGMTWYAVSRDSGKTFEKPICVVDRASRKPGLEYSGSDMAVNNNGQVFVVMSTNAWKLKMPPNEFGYRYAYLAAGASTFSPVVNLNNKPSQGFSIAADDHGNVAAVYLLKKALTANFSADGGRTFSANTTLDADCDPCPCCTTSAAFAPNGDLAVLYREETANNRDMYLVIRHRTGKTTRQLISTTLWKVDACPMSCYAVTPAGDGYIAAWPTKGQVYFAKLDKDGKPLPPAETVTAGRTAMHEGILALPAATGETLVAWKHAGHLTWQLYDAASRPSGPQATAASAGNWAAGVLLGDGRFVLFQ